MPYIHKLDYCHMWKHKEDSLSVAGIANSGIFQIGLKHPPELDPFAIMGQSIKEVHYSPPLEPFHKFPLAFLRDPFPESAALYFIGSAEMVESMDEDKVPVLKLIKHLQIVVNDSAVVLFPSMPELIQGTLNELRRLPCPVKLGKSLQKVLPQKLQG